MDAAVKGEWGRLDCLKAQLHHLTTLPCKKRLPTQARMHLTAHRRTRRAHQRQRQRHHHHHHHHRHHHHLTIIIYPPYSHHRHKETKQRQAIKKKNRIYILIPEKKRRSTFPWERKTGKIASHFISPVQSESLAARIVPPMPAKVPRTTFVRSHSNLFHREGGRGVAEKKEKEQGIVCEP